MRNSVRVFSSDSKHAIQIPPPSLPFHIRDSPLSLAFQSRNAPTPPLSQSQSRLRWELATSVTLRYAIPFSSPLPSCEVVPTSTHLILSSHLVNTPHLHFQHRRQSPPSVLFDGSFLRKGSFLSESVLFAQRIPSLAVNLSPPPERVQYRGIHIARLTFFFLALLRQPFGLPSQKDGCGHVDSRRSGDVPFLRPGWHPVPAGMSSIMRYRDG